MINKNFKSMPKKKWLFQIKILIMMVFLMILTDLIEIQAVWKKDLTKLKGFLTD